MLFKKKNYNFLYYGIYGLKIIVFKKLCYNRENNVEICKNYGDKLFFDVLYILNQIEDIRSNFRKIENSFHCRRF